MGSAFSSPLDVCGTNPRRDTTSEVRKRRRRDWDNESQASTQFLCNLLEFNTESLGETTPPVHNRSVKKHVFTIEQEEDGNHAIVHPRNTLWYGLYVKNPLLNKPKFLRKFRSRFRLPYHKFVELVELAKEAMDDEGDLFFRRWMSADVTGIPSSPIELLILGSLRYLGRGWTFDDIEEATAISEEVHRVFFHIFIKFGADVLYKMWVNTPTTEAEAEEHVCEMRMAGMNGCVGSTDATHIIWHNCSYKHRQMHLGYKVSLRRISSARFHNDNPLTRREEDKVAFLSNSTVNDFPATTFLDGSRVSDEIMCSSLPVPVSTRS